MQALACHPIAAFGSPEQQARWLPPLLAGELLAGYSLSEPQAGSDAAALACKAERTDDGYRITGTKAWITHGGKVDLYALFARTGPGSGGVSCFLAPGHADGLSFGKPEQKMGLHAIPTVTAHWDGAVIDADRLVGARARACRSRSARSTPAGWASPPWPPGSRRRALDAAVDYAHERTAFGRAIIDHEGLGFLLADMAAAVDAARATYLDAARRRDAGLPTAARPRWRSSSRRTPR